MIFALRIIIEKSWEYNKPAYIAFIDLEKAFDSVPRKKLWKCLGEKYNITGKLKRAIMSLYEPCMCNIRTGYKNDKWFNVKSGVKQGSVISPLLFIAYMDEALRIFKVKFDERGKGDTMIYADDIALWSSNKEDIVKTVQIWDEVLTEIGLKMNVGKTEIMTVSRHLEEDIVIEIRGNSKKCERSKVPREHFHITRK